MSFAGYEDALEPSEIAAVAGEAKPVDPGGDCLPFDHLEDRRFEILSYRLLCAELNDQAHRVRLMQGSGERGRDVLIYDDAGRLATIAQCKKYQDRLDRPLLLRELLKLALHAHLDGSLLGSASLNYEIWCPGGLTEPAARFVDAWPAEWTETTLATEAAKVLRKFAAFAELTWESAKDFVTRAFPARMRVRHVDGFSISARVRKYPGIYESFFEGKLVMRKEHVDEAIEGTIRRVMGEKSRYLEDGDARHVLDRIVSFGADERLVSNSTVLLGLKPDLIARFRRGEYDTFVKHLIEGLYGLMKLVMDALGRIQVDVIHDFRERTQPRSRSLPNVLGQILTMSMIARLNELMMPTLNMRPELNAYEKLSLDERFAAEGERLWQSYQNCFAGYEPAKHAPGSDEEFRMRIAAFCLEGLEDRAQFEADLGESYRAHRKEIERVFEEWMRLVPTQLLMIADSVSIFENEWLFKRTHESVERLVALRGSPIIPE
jgi:hypothetical protein